ncbi:modulator of macroautophagy TMEM150B isoform X2 [Sphaerodactylus townsendi]|uniref:modulator of macroautophagy TMEM150B isoform X2 n=1 Tax=Sphaerodactylus townsendi TaxID=933632 RepID=UPI00202647D3|nr:modulator of macroautophagy TMEM150B isoform X2 [Sphaerodactylus townsendi]
MKEETPKENPSPGCAAPAIQAKPCKEMLEVKEEEKPSRDHRLARFWSSTTMWVWALLPVLLAVGGSIGFWTVYVMAVANGSVNITEAFPYISTCGSYPPQSCIFGQVLNIGASLGVVICYLKYQQLRDYGCNSYLNLAGLISGLLCALGSSVVGNFQQYNQLETHLFGAFLAFVVAIVLFNLELDSESAYCEWALAMDLFLLFGLFAVDFWHVDSCSVYVQYRMMNRETLNIQASTQTLPL